MRVGRRSHPEHFEKRKDDAIDNAVNSIKAKPKFKRGLAFSINCLQKAALESGTQNRDNCFFLHRGNQFSDPDGGVACFSLLLEHHPDDEEIVKTCGKCLQQVLKLLIFEKVVANAIECGIPAKAVEVIQFESTTAANKELYIDILERLCLKIPEFNKFYDQGVATLVSKQLAASLAVDWDTQTDEQKKTTEAYIRLASGIASKTPLIIRKHW